MRRMRISWWPWLALVLLFSPGEGMRAATVPVTNGSFEVNSTDGGSTYQPLYVGFNGLPGWRWSSSPLVVLIGNPPSNPGYAYATPFGQWQLDLSGSDNTTGGWIETDLVGLTPGTRYDLSLRFGTSRDFLASGGPPALEVRVDGAQAARFTHLPTAAVEWTPLTYRFTANATRAVLRFTDVAPTGTGLVSVDDLHLDSVVEVQPTVAVRRGTEPGEVLVDFTGTLESSADLRTWQAVPGATGPWKVIADGAAQWFRARVP